LSIFEPFRACCDIQINVKVFNVAVFSSRIDAPKNSLNSKCQFSNNVLELLILKQKTSENFSARNARGNFEGDVRPRRGRGAAAAVAAAPTAAPRPLRHARLRRAIGILKN